MKAERTPPDTPPRYVHPLVLQTHPQTDTVTHKKKNTFTNMFLISAKSVNSQNDTEVSVIRPEQYTAPLFKSKIRFIHVKISLKIRRSRVKIPLYTK